MKVIILHLSDIHIKFGTNPVLTRVSSIANVLNICTYGEECTCFLVISGDIAYSGDSQEYKIAHKFIDDLLKEICINKNIKNVYPILVPGNHDCNFKKAKSTRANLIDHLLDEDNPYIHINDDLIGDLTCIQDEYFAFLQQVDSECQPTNPIYWLRNFEIGKYNIRFLCLNTAWMSTKEKESGRLLFPVKLIDNIDSQHSKDTITVSVFHHPYDWFDPRYRRDFKNQIRGMSNIIITGHEHDIDNQTHISIKGKIQEVMQGGLLQLDDKTYSSFNIQIVDLLQQKQSKKLLVWDEQDHYYKPEEETEWLPFLSFEIGNLFTLRKNHRKFLARLDIQMTHPKSSRLLEIEDVYVDPSLDISYSKNGVISKYPETTSNIDHLLNVIKEYRKVLIVGNKYFGKTLLLKKLFTLLFNEDFVPIYCKGRDLLRLGKQTESAIKQLFNYQYENERDVRYQKYRQLPLDKKVILVDDLNKTELGIRKIETLLDNIDDYFGFIILASNPIININEIFNSPGALIDYTRVKLNDFGLPIISDLVEKWTNLIYPDSPDAEVQHRIKMLENSLFNEINRDITPRNPFFLLSILHKQEIEKSPEAQTGAYGYYFQTIINIMVAKVAESPDLIGYVYDYFCNLAFQLLDNKMGKIDKTDLEKMNEIYLDRTGFTLNLPNIINNSVKEEILLYEQDYYSFTRNYYLAFFAAKYISDNIRNPKLHQQMIKIIEQVSLHLHKDIYCEAMMFLCFHSNDPIILEVVTRKANIVFNDLAKFDMHKDVQFLNKLTPEPKIRYLAEKSVKETKKELLEASDMMTNELGEVRYGLVQDIKRLEDLNIVNKIVYGYSLVKVLAQIIKRYLPGDLEDRITLTKECYDLGLYTIKYVFDQIEREIPSIQAGLASCILQRNPSIANDKLGSTTTDWIWALSESICMSSIKNISQNVGAPQLQKVYRLILDKYPDIAYRFIDISIELDHFEEIPERKIIELAKILDEEKNHFCKDLLSLLFMYHIYQFDTPMQKIQRIASALGLEHIIGEPNIFSPTKKMLPRKIN